ncbi:putative secondary metabolism biosynthetic enzyme [Glutinoglossum americanum]|uniref:Secondary metabolism biosynthetic enzyme n=1 Tax=Glutinoglossum americanum TaxID=1670608 RepID=A0A9P8I3A3_9PEZI|nr:putative secondary metabolism biosynthetic enzyme [Glutinoglossum americanum]
MPIGSALWRSLRAYQVYGANTDVGKTIMATLLCRALERRFPGEGVWYLKPVSTGLREEADDRHVARFSGSSTHCLFQFDEPVSPHIAARPFRLPPDSSILQKIFTQLSDYASISPGTVLLETAGGVHSPTPSGTSQADFYRPLRLPVVFVADHRLGGVSTSVSAFESLHMRGYDVDSVMLFRDTRYQNDEYLSEFFKNHGISTFSLPSPPVRRDCAREDGEAMAEYYERVTKLDEVDEMISLSVTRHKARVESLETLANRANKHIWYPFTQHGDMSPSSIMAIDSAHGDFFQTCKPNPSGRTLEASTLIQPTFDGSASWWTQGLGHANPTLSLAASYAAGRYGHVMFAGGIHEPALSLAELLLKAINNPRLQRVFYSDNGSSGMEIAIKMGLRAASVRYGWGGDSCSGSGEEVGILGLKGSYHGDTLGAMDCSEPSAFNRKVEWYRGRGFWFDYPRVKMIKGTWVVEPPEGLEDELGPGASFASLGAVFDVEARKRSCRDRSYKKYILSTLERLIKEERKRFGALVMEPVVLGAGGMVLVDPLFQHTLATVIRSTPRLFPPSSSPSPLPLNTWTGIPIITDEVFTGLYRLGRPASSSFLHIHPDISVYAKLLTGGLVPLCATAASESVFEAFLGEGKESALLHGHSYTAHAVGCKVAEVAVRELAGMEEAWKGFRKDWLEGTSRASSTEPEVWSHWSKNFVGELSHAKDVESVIAIGSILAISLHDHTGAGYTSTAANAVQKKLFSSTRANWNIHARVLGNVLYLMASQTASEETIRAVEGVMRDVLL